jgi:Cation transport ATPase
MMMIKMQRWFTRFANPLLGVAALLTATGWLLQHGGGSPEVAGMAYGIATLVAGMPILLKAIAALRARVASIELLVSIAVLGALIIGELEEAAMVTFLLA